MGRTGTGPHCHLLQACTLTCAVPLAHRIQSLFNSLGDEVKGATIGLGGDGRYFNKQAAQIILKIAAAAGVKKARMLCLPEAA